MKRNDSQWPAEQEAWQRALLKDAEFLKAFIDFLTRDIQAGSVISAVVITTLTETVGKISYNAGRYNQCLIEAGKSSPSTIESSMAKNAVEVSRFSGHGDGCSCINCLGEAPYLDPRS